MRKILSVALFAATISFAQAQVGYKDAVNTAASTAGLDINKTTSSIMQKVIPALTLSDVQKPNVSGVISSFLTDKSKILSLASTDKTAYETKRSSLFNTLKSKLTPILSSDQMKKFLSLKPATNDPKNALSQLFY